MNAIKRWQYGVLCMWAVAVLALPGLAFAQEPQAPGDGGAARPGDDSSDRWVCKLINGSVLISWWLAREGDKARCPQAKHTNYTFSWDNDSWFAVPDDKAPDGINNPTDENYTNGIFLESKTRLMDAGGKISPSDPFVGYAFGNMMFTPIDTKQIEVVNNERPYAGVLFFSFFREEFEVYKRSAWFPYERREITVSLLGRYSLSEWLQQGIHVFSDRDISRGWDNQIGTDVGLALHYTTYPFVLDLGNIIDVAQEVSLNVGSPFTDVSVGLRGRVGMLQPYYEHGPSNHWFSFYLFGNIERKFVVFNATLEGGGLLRTILSACEQCENPHTVEKDDIADYVTTAEAGISLKFNLWNNGAIEFRLSWVRQTAEISAADFNDDGHNFVRFTVIAPFGGA